jgi:hypothetical protein
MIAKLTRGAAAIALVALAAGCEEDPVLVGDLQVAYRIGSGTQTCEDAGIAFVRIDVMVNASTLAQDMTVNCDPTNQSVVFNDLSVGNYIIRIQGLDRDNNVIYTGESTDPVPVAADVTNGPVTIRLEQVRPSIMIWFGFAEVGGCDRFEVEDITVLLYENGSVVVFDEEFACVDRIQDGLLIEDLSESSTYDVRIRGTNANGEYLYEYNQDAVAVRAGVPTEISAELESCNGICSAP